MLEPATTLKNFTHVANRMVSYKISRILTRTLEITKNFLRALTSCCGPESY